LLDEFTNTIKTLSGDAARYNVSNVGAHRGQFAYMRVTFTAVPRSTPRLHGGFRASWSACPQNSYWSIHCNALELSESAGAGVSECRASMAQLRNEDDDQIRLYERKCYRLFRKKLPWYRAAAACRSWGGSLVVPETMVERQLVSQMLRRGIAWSILSDASKHAWSGWEAINGGIGWVQKGVGDNSEEKDCVAVDRAVDSGEEGFGVWKFRECSQPLAYACSRHSMYDVDFGFPPNSMPSISERRGYAYIDFPLSWQDADTWCRVRGGELAVITNDREQNLAQQYAISSSVWIGVSDMYAQSGHFQYSRGQADWARTLLNTFADESPR